MFQVLGRSDMGGELAWYGLMVVWGLVDGLTRDSLGSGLGSQGLIFVFGLGDVLGSGSFWEKAGIFWVSIGGE